MNQEIDICGKEIVRWEEFVDELVSMANNYHSNAKEGGHEQKRYYPSTLRDETSHDNKLVFIRHYQGFNRTVLLERDSPKIKIYDSGDLRLCHSLRGHKGAVLAVDYLPMQDMLCSSSKDRRINFWDLKRMTVVKSWKLEKAMLSLINLPGGQLCTADTLGKLYLWNVDRGTLLWTFALHAKAVTDLAYLRGCQYGGSLASCSLDGTIRIWKIQNQKGKETQEFSEVCMLQEKAQNPKGLILLDYSEKSNLLATTDGSNSVVFWDIKTKNIRQKIKIGESHSSVVGVNMQHPDEIIIATSSGEFRVYNQRNFAEMQSFRVLRMNSRLKCFTVDHSKGIILAACDKIKQFVSSAVLFTDNIAITPIVFAKFNPYNLTFITIENNNIKIWDALTGKLDRTLKQVTKSRAPITSACLDDAMRRVFIGDHDGNIRVLNSNSGVVLRDMDPHEKEVSAIVQTTLDGSSAVLSGSWDNTLRKHLDENVKTTTVRSVKKAHSKDIVVLAVSQTSPKVVVSGSADGECKLYDANLTFKAQLGHSSVSCLGPVNYAIFLGTLSVLLVADTTGNLSLWSIGVNPKLMVIWTNLEDHHLDNPEPMPVTCLAFDQTSKCVYTGDGQGRLKRWGMSKTLELLKKPEFYRSQLDQDDEGKRCEPVSLKPELVIRYHRSTVLGIDVFFESGKREAEKGGGHRLVPHGEMSLLSWDSDGNVCIFDVKGALLGVLREGEQRKWDFKVSSEERQQAEREILTETMREMKDREKMLQKRQLELESLRHSRADTPIVAASFITQAQVDLEAKQKLAPKVPIDAQSKSPERAMNKIRHLKNKMRSSPLKSKPYLAELEYLPEHDLSHYKAAELTPKNGRSRRRRSHNKSVDDGASNPPIASPSQVYAMQKLDEALENAFK